MTKNTIPLVVVSCLRDMPMLALQAHSMHLYYQDWLPEDQRFADIFIIVNEDTETDQKEWLKQYQGIVQEWHRCFNIKILYKHEFQASWHSWIPSNKNPWAVGWETQQILKFAIADFIDAPGYLVLDSQNFLVSSWSTDVYLSKDGRLPYRPAEFNMPISIWKEYCNELNLSVEPNDKTLNICTPIFFNTELVKSLLHTKSSLYEFAEWFKSASKIKSEFTLYHLWAEKTGGLLKYHYEAPSWGGYMLRDNPNFEAEFDMFMSKIRHLPRQAWVSINHRAWGDMTDNQYEILKTKLDSMFMYGGHFDDYRKNYVHIVF
jgi:hypothetical protein